MNRNDMEKENIKKNSSTLVKHNPNLLGTAQIDCIPNVNQWPAWLIVLTVNIDDNTCRWKWIEREPDVLLRSRENRRKYSKLPLVSL